MGRNSICVIYDSDENYAKRLMSVINDDMVNGSDSIFIERNGHMEKWDKKFESVERLSDVAQRIAAMSNRMVLMGMEMPVTAIRSQISSAIDIVVHLARLRDKSRKVVQIAEVGDYIGGEVALTPLYKFVETGQDKNGKVFGKLVRQENSLIRTEKLKAAGYM